MEARELAQFFITIGATFLIGLAANAIGSRTHLPRVTLLILLGFLIGPFCLDLLPEGSELLFQLAANIALTLVGFLLGEKLGHVSKGAERSEILIISAAVVVGTALIVFAGLYITGTSILVALFLSAFATATAPAATADVVRETKIEGPFSQKLLAVVAIDDAWGLLIFSIVLSAAELSLGDTSGAWDAIAFSAWDIGGAMVIGSILGVIMAYLTGRLEKGEPTNLEAIGLVFLSCGLSLWLEVSFILTSMVMGVIVSRLAKHHERPFHVIENIELPFMILFFVLAGASLEITSLGQIGWLGLAYIGFRMVGRIVSGWLGAKIAGSDKATRRWIGLSLMPQAGVALGMALIVVERIPSVGTQLLQLTIGATVFFELIGPLLTRIALLHSKPRE